MEGVYIVVLSLVLATGLAVFFSGVSRHRKLPPGPAAIPFIGNLLWIRWRLSDIETLLRRLRSRYGPIITLRIGSRAAIFICDHALAHEALVAKGAAFADRPATSNIGRILSANRHSINTAGYGPIWRLLRRNLMTEVLHPSRMKSYSVARAVVLERLIQRLKSQSEDGKPIRAIEDFQFAMFTLLVFMCFGQRLDDSVVRDVERTHREMLLSFNRLNVFAFFPRVGRWIFWKRWNEVMEIRRKQSEILLPLIRAREENLKKELQGKEGKEGEKGLRYGYVDSLLALEMPEDGGRKPTDEEILTLCEEFLNAGTDTTSTALQWVMANLVKYPEIQNKLVEDIERPVEEGKGGDQDFIKEEDLQKMGYLKAVVLEALRRHPPGHFVLPHSVTEEVEIKGYVIPKEATINFTVADMGWDERVWEKPMEFKPERFLNTEEVDITGTREIKMMPFGAGRRMCPGLGLAMLHLEWFTANLVREFEWKSKDGAEVDLSEKPEFTTVMKYPLEAVVSPRRKTVQSC